MSARELAAADVVLTTYDVLKRDVARQPDLEQQTRSLRNGKRWAGSGDGGSVVRGRVSGAVLG